VGFKAFGESQILDIFCSQRGYNCHNVVTFVLMLLFFVNGTFEQDFQSL
jgi:hypothetical protein